MAKSVLRVLTDISEVKSTSEDNISRSFIDMDVRSNGQNLQDIVSVQHTSQLLNKKNHLHPLLSENHPYRAASQYGPRLLNSSRSKVSEFTQRIVSAKLLRVKELRNQVNLMQHQINELTNENRLLKTLQKRQETALHKYEGTEAKLPQLIQSHNEEVRMLTSKCKQMRINNQKLNEKLKLKESQLQNLQEQHMHLLQLTRDQNLGEREELAQKVTDFERTVKEQSDLIQLLTRKVDLERKNYKHELSTEINKRKSIEQKLSLAMRSIDALKEQVETKEKFINSAVPSRYVRSSNSHSQIIAARTRPQLPPSLSNMNTSTVNTSTHTIPSNNEQTADEGEITSETGNTHLTDENNKYRNPMHMPKIKQPKVNRASHANYKLSNIQIQRNSKLIKNDESTDYSSFFTSTEDSSKDISKMSAVDSEKISEKKKEFFLKSYTRRSSFDSESTNRSEKSVASNETSDTSKNSNSSSKNRRNSISVVQDPLEGMEQFKEFLMQTNIESRLVAQKSIRDELQELEEQLMRGTDLLSSNKKNVECKLKNNNDLTDTLISRTTESGNSKTDSNNESSLLWTGIRNNTETSRKKIEVQQYSEAEMTTDPDYTSPYSTLNQDQKLKLLKALEDIDREVHGVGSSEEFEEDKQSDISKRVIKKSDYYYSQTDDSLFKEKLVSDKFRYHEENESEKSEYMKDPEIVNKKNKDEFMKELFGSLENLKIESYNTQFSTEVNK